MLITLHQMAWTALKISAFFKNDVKSFQIRALAGNTASESSACHRSCWAKACSLVVTLLSMWQKKTEEMCSRGHDLLEPRSQELFIATGLNGSEKQWNDTTQLWRVLWYFLRQLLLSLGDKKLPYFEKKMHFSTFSLFRSTSHFQRSCCQAMICSWLF